MTALPQMAKMLDVIVKERSPDDTEVDFRGGSVRVGFFVRTATRKLFIQAGVIGSVRVLFDTDELTRLQEVIRQVLAKMQTLGYRPLPRLPEVPRAPSLPSPLTPKP